MLSAVGMLQAMLQVILHGAGPVSERNWPLTLGKRLAPRVGYVGPWLDVSSSTLH